MQPVGPCLKSIHWLSIVEIKLELSTTNLGPYIKTSIALVLRIDGD